MTRFAAILTTLSISLSAVAPAATLGPRHRATAAAIPASAWAPTATQGLPLRTDLGAAPAATPIHIAVALRGNRAGADAMLRHIYTKGDPQYRQFLTPAQFTALFSPSAAQAAAVAAYLTNEGMSNVSITPNRLLVTADTTVAGASAAFNTQIHSTVQGSHGAYANVAPAQVPAALGGTVAAVIGLDNFQMQRFNHRMSAAGLAQYVHGTPAVKSYAQLHQQTAPPQFCNDVGGIIYGEISGNTGQNVPGPSVTAPLPFCYPSVFTPSAFRLAYNDEASPTAGATSIADFTEGAVSGPGGLNSVVSDLFQMEVQNGIPESPVSIIQVNALGTDTSGQTEWDIDSQAAVGIAGGVRAYYFYNATDLSTESMDEMFSRFATDDGVQIGNASFGGCESLQALSGGLTATDMILAEAALQGQTVTVSTGDSGSQGCLALAGNGTAAGVPGVEYPSTSPYALAVGGTSLLANSTDGTYYSEVTWCNALSCGGGGGVSTFEPQSPWQGLLVGNTAGVPERMVPDVAMDADPYTGLVAIVSGQIQAGWGGTSLAAPLAQGVWARLMSHHNNKLGNAAAALYAPYIAAGGGIAPQLGGTISLSAPNGMTPQEIGGLNDVFLGTNTLYQATPGFDLNTGMGTFNINDTFIWFGS